MAWVTKNLSKKKNFTETHAENRMARVLLKCWRFIKLS